MIGYVISTIVTLVLFGLVAMQFEKKKERLKRELHKLEYQLKIYQFASMHDLSGTGTRDFHDLIYYLDRGDGDKVSELLERVPVEVDIAFQKWKRR